MLTIIADPAGITGRQRHGWDISETITQNVMRHLPGGGADCEVWLNGRRIDPRHDPAMHQPPHPADMMLVARRPEGFDPITWAIAIVIASVAVSYALMPKVPDVAGAGKDSPNNRLTQQTNVARAYQAIPDVYGLRRVWPDLIQPSTVEYIDNIKFVTEWLCVSRGKGTITEVSYADTLISDIDGASFEVFEPSGADPYPERNSTTLTDVIETFDSPEVNGQEIRARETLTTVVAIGELAASAGASEFECVLLDTEAVQRIGLLEAAGGTAVVAFSYPGGTFSQTCTLLNYSVSGRYATLTWSRSGTWATSLAEDTISFDINPTDTYYYTTLGPYTLPIACDRIRWNTVFLRGLRTDDEDITIEAQWWKVNGSGVEIGGTRQTQNFIYRRQTYDQRFYTEEVTPSAGSGLYKIQFTRLSPERGSGGYDVAKLEELYAVRYYATKTLPGVTVIKVTTQATEQAIGISERKFNVMWNRHVRTLTSNTLSASRNFGRAMAHIWTLAGNDIAQLDTAALAAINTEFGETSPLLRFDGSFDDYDKSLGERLQVIADNVRCVVWRDGTKWTVTRDQARSGPTMQLDYRNLAAGGESAISYAAHLPASNDGVEVEYVAEDTQATKAYVRLSIASGAVVTGSSANPKKIKLPGCTTAAQATNRANLEARRLLYQRVSVSDEALQDAITLGIGECVRWVDPNDWEADDNMQAGEVVSRSSNLIRTSETIDWKGYSTGRMLFTTYDGSYIGAPIVVTPGTGGTVALASVPGGLFTPDETQRCGSRYVFSVGITAPEMEAAGLYTVTSVKPTADGTCSLALAAYDERIYEAD